MSRREPVRFREKLARVRFAHMLADLRFLEMVARARSRPPKAVNLQLMAIWIVLGGALTGIWIEWGRISPSPRFEPVALREAETAATATDLPLVRDEAAVNGSEPPSKSADRPLRTIERRGLYNAHRSDVLQSNRLSYQLRRSGRAD